MPCDQIVLCKIEITATNADLLTAALETLIARKELRLWDLNAESAAQLAGRIQASGFIRVVSGKESLADRIKQEYSRQAVQAAARKFGWRVQEKTPQKLTVTRRV